MKVFVRTDNVKLKGYLKTTVKCFNRDFTDGPIWTDWLKHSKFDPLNFKTAMKELKINY